MTSAASEPGSEPVSESGAPSEPAGAADAPSESADAADAADAAGAADASEAAEAELPARDRAVLALERRGWRTPGLKERAIREQLGISPTRYYQVLNALLDDPRAQAHDPVTVNRLRRVRDARRSRR